MEWLSIPLIVLGFALMVQGFPNIHIGTKVNNYYYNDELDDELDEPTNSKKK